MAQSREWKRRQRHRRLIGWLLPALLGPVVAGGLVGLQLGAQEKHPPVSPDVALIPADGAMIISARLADVWSADALKPVRERIGKDVAALAVEIEKNLGARPEQIERWTGLVPSIRGGGEIMVVRLKDRADIKKVMALAGDGVTEEKYKGYTTFVGASRDSVALVDERTYVVGRTDPVRGLLDAGARDEDGPLAAAKRLMGQNHTFVLGLNLPATRDAAGEELPPQAEPLKPMLDARSAVLYGDLAGTSRARARLVFADADAARKGAKALRAGLDLARTGLAAARKELRGQSMAVKLLGQVDEAVKVAAVEQKGDVVQAAASLRIDTDLVAPAAAEIVVKMTQSSRRIQGTNNLKQIALAMHNFHSVYNHLPPAATYDNRGKPLLSWRVQLLPFLEADELYKEFHLDEPWDSDHNKKLLDKMPRVYADPNHKGKTHLTPYQVFVGKGAMFEGKTGVSLANVPDGTSNTILVVETRPEVPWTKPEDLPFDVDKPLRKLGGLQPDGFQAAFADGSVHFVKKTASEKTLKILIGRNDGQVVPADF
jgi:hypothetical protein